MNKEILLADLLSEEDYNKVLALTGLQNISNNTFILYKNYFETKIGWHEFNFNKCFT